MEFSEFYSYANPIYASLQPIAREVSNTFLFGNRVGDTIKEKVRRDLHMTHTSDFLHGIAHKCLEHLDEFADILHSANLPQEYPATDELTEEIDTLDKAFYVFTETLRDIKTALYRFVEATDNADNKAMSIKAEDILEDVDDDFAKLITAWNQWKCDGSAMSFDKWVDAYFKADEVED